MDTRAVAFEFILLLAAQLLLVFIGSQFSYGGLILFFVPGPAMLVSARRGALYGIGLALAASLFWLGGPSFSVAILAALLAGGVAPGVALRQGKGPVEAILTGAGLVLLAAFFALLTWSLAKGGLAHAGQALNQSFSGAFAQLRQSLVTNYTRAGMPSAKAASQAAGVVSQIKANYLPMFPALMMFWVFLQQGVVVLVCRAVLRRQGQELSAGAAFAQWSAPVWVAPVYLVGVAMLLLFNWKGHVAFLWVGANLAALAGAVLSVHALAVLYFFAHRLKLARQTRILMLILVAVLVGSFLAWLGVADTLSDFRKRANRMGGA